MDPAARRVLQSLLDAGVRHVPIGVAAPCPDVAAAGDPPPDPAAPRTPPDPGREQSSPSRGSTTPADRGAVLAEVARQAADCTACKLCERRTQAVPGEGAPDASIVFVGEGPGADEDRSGRPFVGPAGQLLDDIITKGMGLRREDVFICNIVKCRPPGNRDPQPDEVAACSDFLERQLLAIGPRVICALGANAARLLLQTDAPLGRLRGRAADWRGIPVIPTYHPAYLLRSPEAKRPTWEDIQKVMHIARTP
ncbi:MAG: uracil-DNA glycosylase [Planctomycetota bacterium]|nr:MAG: uracil-DNA glycosylase [Planctomycetota bacterium]